MQRSGTSLVILGTLCLLLASSASLLLVLEHVGGLSLPGCGEGSSCARAAASAWARLPVIHWPTAFLGFAYFIGALVAWLLARARVHSLFRLIVRVGALISLGLVAVLVLAGYACNYCLTAHLANFAFWIIVELARIKLPPPEWRAWRPTGVLIGAFLAISVVLGAVQALESGRFVREQEAERQASAERIAAASTAAGTASTPAAGSSAANDSPWEEAFTGRYLLGPEEAAVRIVTITDYQCPDCGRIEDDIMELLARYENVSFSTKHFPMCEACNPHAVRTLHPNACWAARAAEAAGLLRGAEGFYQMHDWLFKIKGTFDRESLRSKLGELGYDIETFTGIMRSPQPLEFVQADIEEALWLGLHYTPMVFINGIEMKGVRSPKAVARTVEEILALDPPRRTAQADQPPPALQKYIDDWQGQRVVRLPADSQIWSLGADDPRATIVLWGDYQEPNTAEADIAIRALLEELPAAQYHFRHYPVNSSCNPASPIDKYPLACLAATAAEAAGRLGGPNAYWAMHAWLMEHQAELSEEAVLGEAARLGLDRAAFTRARMGDPAAAAIRADGEAGGRLGFRSIPAIYVNGRNVPRWSLDGADTPLRRILERALEEAS